jgi:hypothetical protein
VSLLAAAPNLDHIWFILDQQSDRLAAKLPELRQFPDPIVPLERRLVREHCHNPFSD